MGDDDSDDWLSSARSVADGAGLHYAATLLVTGMGFLLNLLLTRTLGASAYGLYAYGLQIVQSALSFANLGTDVSINRYLSANLDDPAYQQRVLGMAYLTTGIASVLAAAGLFVAAPTITAYTLDEPGFTLILQAFAVALPFEALTHLVVNTFRGLELPVQKNLVTVSKAGLRLLAVAAAVLVGLSLLGVVAAIVVAAAMVFLAAMTYSLSRTGLRPSPRMSRGEAAEFYNFSIPLTFARAANLLYKRVDVFMVGILLASAHVGIYNIAVLLAGIIAMPLAGINQLFPPVASRLHADGDLETLQTVYVTVTRWSITASILVSIPLLVYSTELLALFGPEFVAGAGVLILFVIGQLANAAAGPANDLLTMTGHQYVVLANHWIAGIVNVALNYYLILEFGLIGAALATASVLAAVNVVRVVEVWYLEGLFAYSRALWKPFVAAGVAVVAMVVPSPLLSGLPLVIVGGVVCVVVFGLALYALGIEEHDRRLADEYFGLIDDATDRSAVTGD